MSFLFGRSIPLRDLQCIGWKETYYCVCLRCAVKQVSSREKILRDGVASNLIVRFSGCVRAPRGDSDSLHDWRSFVPRLFVETEIRPGVCSSRGARFSHMLAYETMGTQLYLKGRKIKVSLKRVDKFSFIYSSTNSCSDVPEWLSTVPLFNVFACDCF